MLFSLGTAVAMLTLFAWCYSRRSFFPAHRSYSNKDKLDVPSIFSYYAMYIISIITNQGNIPFMLHHRRL